MYKSNKVIIQDRTSKFFGAMGFSREMYFVGETFFAVIDLLNPEKIDRKKRRTVTYMGNKKCLKNVEEARV